MTEFVLSNAWFLQSSEKLTVHGETISTLHYAAQDWYPVSIPATVVAGLVENRVYDDPYIGLNMKSIPGYKHGKNSHFSFHYMPDQSPFRKPWWYRTTFRLPDAFKGKTVWLHCMGINYSANIWLNGKRVAGNDYISGTFRRYDLDITNVIEYDAVNVLAFELFAPQPDDLCLTFIDWNPVPPDDCMGIWQPVSLRATGPVAVKHPFVESFLDTVFLDRAELVITAELVNTSDMPHTALIEGTIETGTVTKQVTLESFGRATVVFSPKEYSELTVLNPRIWWPYQLGTPELYTLNLRCMVDGALSDAMDVTFGIRDIRSRVNDKGARVFTINGRDILIRGSAWSPDLMLRQSAERDRIDIAMLKTMRLNTLRFEGKLATDFFWDECDREGIMVIAGWPCCNHWEKWRFWKAGDMTVAEESLRSQIKRLRNHPSFIAWMYGSDFPPPEPVERMYLGVIEETYARLPSLSSAAAFPSALRGETGVKMSGPYTYVPPSYWYDRAKPGNGSGFNTETGPDVCIPVLESLKKFLPADQLYPGSPAWNHHAGLAFFCTTDITNEAIVQRFGRSADIAGFARNAQVLGYECWRAMYEAYTRNFPDSTGVIGWKHNSAWPSMFWQLYDYFLEPTGAFYGAQKACEDLHVQYSYDDSSVWVVNSTLRQTGTMRVFASIRSLDSRNVYDRTETVSLDPYERRMLFIIPQVQVVPQVYFLFLRLETDSGIFRNCYWLSSQPDEFVPETAERFYWPVAKHADFSALNLLKQSDVSCTAEWLMNGMRQKVCVELNNVSDTIAFFIRLKMVDTSTGDLIAPLYWCENYITLLPGEKAQVTGEFQGPVIQQECALKLEKWN